MKLGYMLDRELDDIKRIIIHHSSSAHGSVELFRRIHMEDNGYSDIGYNAVIGNGNGMDDGEIDAGRDIAKVPAHCKYQNYDSLGVCVIGNFMETSPTKKQYASLIRQLVKWCLEFNLNPLGKDDKGFIIASHRDYRPTDCPGDTLYAMLPQIRKDVDRRMKRKRTIQTRWKS